jgi:hypothetical protein
MAAAAAVVVLVLGGLAVLALNWPNSGKPAAQQSSSTLQSGVQSHAPGTSVQRSPTAAGPSTTTASDGTVSNWSQAGQLVINYYNGASDVPKMWNMLSSGAQSSFGSLSSFQQYWAQYPQVNGNNANGVNNNPDGSANVPVDVTYTNGRTEHKVVRVILSGGQYLIDDAAR